MKREAAAGVSARKRSKERKTQMRWSHGSDFFHEWRKNPTGAMSDLFAKICLTFLAGLGGDSGRVRVNERLRERKPKHSSIITRISQILLSLNPIAGHIDAH